MGVERSTFVIGKDGKIKKVFPKVKPDAHADRCSRRYRAD